MTCKKGGVYCLVPFHGKWPRQGCQCVQWLKGLDHQLEAPQPYLSSLAVTCAAFLRDMPVSCLFCSLGTAASIDSACSGGGAGALDCCATSTDASPQPALLRGIWGQHIAQFSHMVSALSGTDQPVDQQAVTRPEVLARRVQLDWRRCLQFRNH